MNSLKNMPGAFIQDICNDLAKGLWKLSGEDMDMAVAISQFSIDLRDFIIQELFKRSIVEEDFLPN